MGKLIVEPMEHYTALIPGQGQVRLERDLLTVEQADGVQILEDVVCDMPELADDGEAEDVPVLLHPDMSPVLDNVVQQ